MNKEEFDQKQLWRCPMLGGGVPFRHCRKSNSSLPCPRILECWQGRFDISGFLNENYTGQELEKALQSPQGRLDTILSTIEKFKNRS